MKKILLAAVLFCSACQGACPKCIKGHDEMVLVPAHEETEYIHLAIGDDGNSVTIPINHWVPDHYNKEFICDQYEVERER
jgi:hypothetical protein